MTIVKHLKDSNLHQLRKKQSQSWDRKWKRSILPILCGVIVGTYLDLYFVGAGFYSFPVRPFQEIFSINIGFTLIGLPLLIILFLRLCSTMNKWVLPIILVFAVYMATGEKLSEHLGIFVHSASWKHAYSLFGYSLYFTSIYLIYRWFET